MNLKYKIFLSFFILCFNLLCATAGVFEHEVNLKDISANLPELNSIDCKFAQEKQIPQAKMILKSSGDFKFVKSQGITFYTTYPIKSVTSYNTKEYRQINNIINAISAKSYTRLERDFKFYYTGNTNCWTLGLLPRKESPIFNYLKSIEITGNESMILNMMILSADSTKTKIRFFF